MSSGWCGADSLSRRQVHSGYYHELAAQLSDEPVVWAEFPQCYLEPGR
jgi:hypothetical protein